LAWPVWGFAQAEADNTARTYLVRGQDGSVVERLVAVPQTLAVSAGSGKSSMGLSPLESFWNTYLQARHMPALASAPEAKRVDGQALATAVDPGQLRNWAEFTDPELALRWASLERESGVTHAMLHVPAAGWGQAHPLVRWSVAQDQPATPVNSWKNVVTEGARSALPGQQALRQWLTLPSPPPTSNPWLNGLRTYRY